MICFAQASSSAGLAGRQAKMRRRLGVSPGRSRSNGPVTEIEYSAGWTRGCRSILKRAWYGWRSVSSSAEDSS